MMHWINSAAALMIDDMKETFLTACSPKIVQSSVGFIISLR